MRILQKIIGELPTRENNKYYIDINLLLRRFLDYEVDIPDDLYMGREKKGLIGSAICYLESMEGIKFLEVSGFISKELFADGYPCSNYTGRVSHDFFLMNAITNDSPYVAIQINDIGDPRCYSYERRKNYTDAFLLKFEDHQDFYELVDEVITEEATFSIEVDDKTYLVTPQLKSEILWVRYKEGDEYVDVPDICASSDEEFIEEIRKHNKSKVLK
jgi:hypothetical protein